MGALWGSLAEPKIDFLIVRCPWGSDGGLVGSLAEPKIDFLIVKGFGGVPRGTQNRFSNRKRPLGLWGVRWVSFPEPKIDFLIVRGPGVSLSEPEIDFRIVRGSLSEPQIVRGPWGLPSSEPKSNLHGLLQNPKIDFLIVRHTPRGRGGGLTIRKSILGF